MEKTLANISKQEAKDKKRLEKIEKAGFVAQNNFLISKGFEKLGKNLKALRKTKGNQEEALKLLQTKQENKIKKVGLVDEKIKKQNFETQINFLISKGYKNLKKNLKCLSLYEGDQEKALIHLSQPKNKFSFEEKIKVFKYETQNESLVKAGYSNLKKNFKLLRFYNGDIEKVLLHYNHNKQQKYDLFLKIIEEKGYAKENLLLMEKGHTQLRRNLKFLIKTQGDVNKILEVYNLKNEGKINKLLEISKTHGVSDDFQDLVSKGNKPKKVIKLLKFYDWDAKKARTHLESKKGRHHLFEEQIKEAGYSEQNKALIEKGFKNLKKNLKLLQTHQGNLEKVLECYQKKSKRGDKIQKTLARLNFTKQYQEIMAKDGTLKPKKVIKSLVKYNGDVKEAVSHLERKQMHKEYSVKIWNPHTHVAFLDGNNMLFADDQIRKLYLTNRKKEAEELLIETAKKFGVKKNLDKVVLVFDKGDYPPKEEQILLESKKTLAFILMCAKEHKNADDALVTLAEKEANIHNTIFVTSDRELRRRLIEKGVKLLMSPKNWFEAGKV